MKIVVLGAQGMLGQDVCACLSKDDEHFDVVPCASSHVDITQKDQLDALLQKHRPDGVVNCAAYTQVDDAEDHQEDAFRVNEHAVAALAQLCRTYEILLIHFSTDFVFDGIKDGAYVEDDDTRPLGVYGASKLAGERAVQEWAMRYFILRIAWLYGCHGRSFVQTILQLAATRKSLTVVDDQRGTPTYTQDVAAIVRDVLIKDSKQYGVYHANNSGACSWCDFAKEIIRALGPSDVAVQAIPSSEFACKAIRPKNSVMDNSRIQRLLGYQPRSWQEAFKSFAKEFQGMKG